MQLEHSYRAGEAEGRVTGPPSRYPYVLLSTAEVETAVDEVMSSDTFVIDIETTKQRAQYNALLWVGLGIADQNHLIPCGHPKGVRLIKEHKEKVAACVAYPRRPSGADQAGQAVDADGRCTSTGCLRTATQTAVSR